MWLEVDEIFKNYLPYYFLVFLPIFIIVSPVNPVYGASEFPVYRMQHYDLHGVSHGCRSAAVNLEAKSLTGWTTSRHCVVTRLKDITVDHFRNIKSKAGALLVMLPENWRNLSLEDKQNYMVLENSMLIQDVPVPIYFAEYSPRLDSIISELSYSINADDMTKSSTEALMSSVAANGYQISVSVGTPTAQNDAKIATIQGYLPGYSLDGITPTIAIVAHYDSFGVVPELSFGADSNGSGVAILLELVRIFSNLYADAKTRGKHNILFLLTGGGKINYQGSKKWLEEQLDLLDGSMIQDAAYVMCLDTLASNSSIYMHVSKPPKDGSPASLVFKELKSVAAEAFPHTGVDGVHKKINLADDILGWEHERFSIRRLPAFTLSSLKNHKNFHKSTIFDTRDSLDIKIMADNSKIIAEGLARHIYGISMGNVLGKSWDTNETHIEGWLNYLSNQPRSPQLLSDKDNVLVNILKDAFNKYLRDVKVLYVVPDKRDPDFQFYTITNGILHVCSVA
ncbi:unnamed protein product [Acanthoscelides obtectus]|uniref:BOS complex subunit NCLN n=1 Tax=Acanthoscelides obtectus TaxID=200917 RepID=A0A9P0KQT2_ACAOB|nr:unnamed protein product [Acanthoscelides obtectus]CAK1631913.1 Nicalin [Acanthoscelides obtectus]